MSFSEKVDEREDVAGGSQSEAEEDDSEVEVIYFFNGRYCGVRVGCCCLVVHLFVLDLLRLLVKSFLSSVSSEVLFSVLERFV